MGAFFSALFGVLSSLPKGIELIEKLIVAINQAYYEFRRRQGEKQFDKGVEKAKNEKNTCELEKAFNPDKQC